MWSTCPIFTPSSPIAARAFMRLKGGLPLIRKVPQSQGAYVATGRSFWGILNALATVEASFRSLLGDRDHYGISPRRNGDYRRNVRFLLFRDCGAQLSQSIPQLHVWSQLTLETK
jgi:glycine/D-amino acid oxidase-like deaminating enzyme